MRGGHEKPAAEEAHRRRARRLKSVITQILLLKPSLKFLMPKYYKQNIW